jgi:hypothetical protein
LRITCWIHAFPTASKLLREEEIVELSRCSEPQDTALYATAIEDDEENS